MDFGNKLKYLRTENGMTQQDLASSIGVTTVCIGNWERGIRKPTMDMLMSLSKVFKTSIDYLVGVQTYNTGHTTLTPGELLLLKNYQSLDYFGKKAVDSICALEKQRVDSLKKKTSSKIIEIQKASERFIPKYSTPSAAGFNVPLDGDDFEMILVDDSVPDDADYAVNIQGNSMLPYIHDGDTVFVKKDAELSIGDVGIFCVDGAMYCKQYYLDEENNLVLVSANPELKSSNIHVYTDSGSSVKFLGKVLLNGRVELPDYLYEDE